MKVECRESRVEGRKNRLAPRSCSGSRPSTLDPRPSRRGMTLIELLVVVLILTTIVAAAIPLMSPSNDDRRLREAARGLNTFITGAQTRAIAINRPYGVLLKRLSTDSTKRDDRAVSLELFYIEQPAPYSGYEPNSRVSVAIHPNPPVTVGNPAALVPDAVLVRFVTRGTATAGLPAGWMPDLFPGGTIRVNDVIEINGSRFQLKWPYSDITVDTATGYFNSAGSGNRPAIIIAQPLHDPDHSFARITPRYDDGGAEIGATIPAPAPFWTVASPYKVLRQPTPSTDEPYQLPEGVGIDLRASGIGTTDYFYVPGLNDNTSDVMIMFSPDGRVSRVTFSQVPHNTMPYDKSVVDNLYLLVGRRENAPPPEPGLDPTLQSSITGITNDDDRAKLRTPVNWLNTASTWIVIGSQSGRIATIDNAFVDMASVYINGTGGSPAHNPGSEELRNDQIAAARAFTREMSQLGGR
jgi:prepilin-type N-terminal cleavage/methylation domain-containing protein